MIAPTCKRPGEKEEPFDPNQIKNFDSLLFGKDGKVYLHNKIVKTTIILKVIDAKLDGEVE